MSTGEFQEQFVRYSSHMARNNLHLVHGKEQYFFSYDDGCENELLKVLEDMAKNTECNFDMFDAAILSYQMGKKKQERILENYKCF